MASILETFTINLNEKAKENKLDPVIGRSKELYKLSSVLLKRTKNNPILLGRPGVGKTAIVEELARSIVNETCHHELFDKQILLLDIVSLVSGTSERGSLEERTSMFLKEIEGRDDIILMIDEIHTIVGSDSTSSKSIQSSLNIANMFKPGLSRGLIHCIGATTYDEYAKYFLRDKALDRRFQPVNILEPSISETRDILTVLKPKYEAFHSCLVEDDTIDSCLTLSERFLPYRNFPDKAIDLLDEACSKKNIDKKRNYTTDNIVRPIDIQYVIQQIMNSPLMFDTDEKKMEMLESFLKTKIIGQDTTIDTIIKTLKRHVCGFYNKKRPIASMMFLGPTGTGKTETVNLIADHYYGSRDQNIIRFDMSEYMESNTVASLIGAPPGYVGYSEGGKLTNAIKRNPYSIVLFDEIEKAHPSIFNILLQIIEDGILTDNTGNTFSFRNSIIVMTSNIGFTHAQKQTMGFQTSDTRIQCAYNKDTIHTELKYTFKPEFLNRIDLISTFDYLKKEDIIKITNNLINETIQNIYNEKRIQVLVSNETRNKIYEYGSSLSYGARPLRKGINNLILDPVAEIILNENEVSLKNRWITV